MRILSRSTLKQFWEKHPDAKQALEAWHAEAKHACWTCPNDIKQKYQAADILSNNRVIFDIKGNSYRLVAEIHYNTKTVYIRFVGTHAEYDKVDARKI